MTKKKIPSRRGTTGNAPSSRTAGAERGRLTPERVSHLRLLANFATYVVPPNRTEVWAGYLTDADAGDDILELCAAVDVGVELLSALKHLMQAYESVLPGLAKIAVQDYALINDAPVAAERAIAKAEGRS